MNISVTTRKLKVTDRQTVWTTDRQTDKQKRRQTDRWMYIDGWTDGKMDGESILKYSPGGGSTGSIHILHPLSQHSKLPMQSSLEWHISLHFFSGAARKTGGGQVSCHRKNDDRLLMLWSCDTEERESALVYKGHNQNKVFFTMFLYDDITRAIFATICSAFFLVWSRWYKLRALLRRFQCEFAAILCHSNEEY